jgi:benzoylformate decarboxylase
MLPRFKPLNSGSSRPAAGALLEVLSSDGAEYTVANPGTAELPLIDALLQTPDVNCVLALPEAA